MGRNSGGGGAVQLSYWVDYWLGRSFPSNAGSQRLQYVSSDDAALETLALKNSDNSVVVMVANHAVNASGDNNGPEVLKTVALDLSALGTFSSGSLVTMDKNTSISSGPMPATVTPASEITMTLDGYSVGFLALEP